MANLPISALPETTGITTEALFPVVQGGTTYKIKAGNIPSSKIYGSFYELNTQSGFTANTAYSVSASTTANSSGITVVDGCKFTVASGGTYNIQFSLQLKKTSGGSSENIDIWLSKNGDNVDYSNTRLTLQNNNDLLVASWNFVETLNAGGFFELKISIDNTHVIIYGLPSQTLPIRPAIPSAIITIVQV